MQEYTIVLNVPCNLSKTFKCVTENVEEAIEFAKRNVVIDPADRNQLTPSGHPEIISISAHDTDSLSTSVSFKFHFAQPEEEIPEYNTLVEGLSNKIKEALHKHECKCENEPFYKCLKENRIAQRVNDAIVNGDMAIINFNGTLNKKKYKISIKLSEEDYEL